jgi:hypothetical protein
MPSPWIKFTAIFIVASALMLTGFSLAWYPHYRSEILRLTLEQSSLTQAQRWELEGSLSWWNNTGNFMYGVIGNSVLIGGILVLVYAVVYILTSVWSESKSLKNMEVRPVKLSYRASGCISILNKLPFCDII